MTTETINRYGKLTGHEDTARGRIAYVTDPSNEETTRIWCERESDGTWTVASNTVNFRGAVVSARHTHTRMSTEEAREMARRYWQGANSGF
jgi:hypothetical protein